MDHVAVRFIETERYDISIDSEVIRLIAITGLGSYSAEIPVDNPKEVRRKRQEFKDYVLECMEKGLGPHEVEIG